MAFRNIFRSFRPAVTALQSRPAALRMAAGSAVVGTALFNQEVMAGPAVVDWNAVRQDLHDLVHNEDAVNPGADGFHGSIGGGGPVGPMLLRLGWHSAGTWCTKAKNGGSDGGTMRFQPEAGHGANAGLEHARALIEPIKKKHPNATYADLYILASCVAIEEMGGPVIPFRSGRTDAPAASTPSKDARFSPDGRLPDADKGGFPETAQHMRDIFYRMGFNDQEIVALCGAHALGYCHTDRSGYWGPWTRSPSTFSNDYFRLLFEENWVIKKRHNGAEWKGPLQFESQDGQLMMLPADMACIKDPAFKKYAELYKDDEAKFFEDFKNACNKLFELGVDFPSQQGGSSTLGFVMTGLVSFIGLGASFQSASKGK